MMPNIEQIKKIVQAVAKTRDNEIGCAECYEQIDKFVELVLDGTSPEDALPLVNHHLDMCNGCREEFEALLDALKTVQA